LQRQIKEKRMCLRHGDNVDMNFVLTGRFMLCGELALSGDLYGLVVGVELALAMSCGVGRLGCTRGCGGPLS
jgi:hypothetical protein